MVSPLNITARQQIWLNRGNTKFDKKFDYTKVIFTNANTPVQIGCPDHGYFQSSPWHHQDSKHGCSKCGDAAMGMIQRQRSTEKFWKGVSHHHGNRYDYSGTTFDFITDLIEVRCPTHGPFGITADHHMRGVRCALCANLERKGGYTDAWFNAELVEWLSETNVKYKTWSDIQMEEPYTGFVQICYYIGIDDPEHVMLFKLAWM